MDHREGDADMVSLSIYCLGKRYLVNANLDDTVAFVKKKLMDQHKVDTSAAFLAYRSRKMEDNRTLRSYGISPEAQLWYYKNSEVHDF